jgi:hypothetical protein
MTNIVRFEPLPPLRDALKASHDVLDRAELLRLTAISLRKQADELDALANRVDPTDFQSSTEPEPLWPGGTQG